MDSAALQSLIQACLTWVGFGFISGLTARALLPGRDPGGAIVTFVLGVGGSLIGVATYSWGTGQHIQSLISPIGFAVAVGGALVLLVSHRVLSGRMFGRGRLVEEVIVPGPRYARRRRRAVRYSDVD
jgi:uncharacterized membrane protein YeaQ/YmgE (transglycosylase-associated protein family)